MLRSNVILLIQIMTAIEYREVKPDPQQYLALFETTGWNTVYKADLEELSIALDEFNFKVHHIDKWRT